jgi:hypothetical protein
MTVSVKQAQPLSQKRFTFPFGSTVKNFRPLPELQVIFTSLYSEFKMPVERVK